MAAVSPVAAGKDLWLVSIEVGLCDTGSPECRMVCHQSGGYQDRRFKKGGAFGTATEGDCQMLTRRLERGGGPLKDNLVLNYS